MSSSTVATLARRSAAAMMSKAASGATVAYEPALRSFAGAGSVASRRVLSAAAASDEDLLKTPLWDMHMAAGAKMGPFAGWSMPMQYKSQSVMESTKWVRSSAGMFDVSHMCGMRLFGKDAIKFLETLVVGDIAGLPDGNSTLTVYTNEKGGIVDDSVVTKVSDDHLYIVINAGCRDKDLAHIGKYMDKFKADGGDVDWHIYDERSLLALQGPKAASVLSALVDTDLSTMYFGNFAEMEVAGHPCFVTRTGYTGEDGFEISVPDENAAALAATLLDDSAVEWAGLAARDALRLEAGLCLYGNDLTDDTTPIEAALAWTVGKRRRAEGGFLGADIILDQINNKTTTRRRVGIVPKVPARQHSEIVTADGEVVGEVTSGGFSPCLGHPIGMGYVDKAYAKAGTELMVKVRGKTSPMTVTKMPFVANNYYKPA